METLTIEEKEIETKEVEAIDFDTEDVDFFENRYNDFHVFGSSEDLDYHLECYVDEEDIHINSGHSVNDESDTDVSLDFDKLEKMLNNQITINKYRNDQSN